MMIIALDQSGTAYLRDVDNFKQFKIQAATEAASSEQILQSLGCLGRAHEDGIHIWISIPIFLQRMGSTLSAEWRTNFDTMIEGVAKYGFLNEDRSAVRVHIEAV